MEKSVWLVEEADGHFAAGTMAGLSAAQLLYRTAVEHLFQALDDVDDARVVKLEIKIYLEQAEACDDLLSGAEATDVASALDLEVRAAERLRQWPHADHRAAALHDLGSAGEVLLSVLSRFKKRDAQRAACDFVQKRALAIIDSAEALKRAGVVAVAAAGAPPPSAVERRDLPDVAMRTVALSAGCEVALPAALLRERRGDASCASAYHYLRSGDAAPDAAPERDGALFTASRKRDGRVVRVLVRRLADDAAARCLAQCVTAAHALALRSSVARGSVRSISSLAFEGVLDSTRCWVEFARAAPLRAEGGGEASSPLGALRSGGAQGGGARVRAAEREVGIAAWARAGGAGRYVAEVGRDWRVQGVFRQLLQTLAVLHSTNVVAGVIDEENTRIVVAGDGADEERSAAADVAAEERAGGSAAELPPAPVCRSAQVAAGAAADAAVPLVVLCPVPLSVSALRRQSICAPELLAGGESGGEAQTEGARAPRSPSAASDMWAVS